MRNILKNLSLFSFLLCLVPCIAWIIKWQWQSDKTLTVFDHALYWLTETGSVPYAVITCGIFALLYFWLIPNKKQAILVIVIMAFSIALTQGIKTGLKNLFAEPRPFITALTTESNFTTEQFYRCSKLERSEIVRSFYREKSDMPMWLVRHHSHEIGYSFPSGHSIFAASWLLLAVGFYCLIGKGDKKLKILTALITIWAVLMLISRLRLGMHYPIDLLVSVLIAWLVHIVMFIALKKRFFIWQNQLTKTIKS